jgi:arsenite methyltransferase
VAGALTERDFVEKLEKAGFGEIQVHERDPVSVDDLALYPLFTAELIELMRTLVPPDRQSAVATSVVITARRGGESVLTGYG